MQYRSDKQSKSVSPCYFHVQLFQYTKKCEHKQIGLLTYSIYFSYAIFLTDYKKILKIAGEVKQLTSPTSDPNCSMPENDAQCVIPVKRTSRGFVVMCMYIR
jgi:hypothetical protein